MRKIILFVLIITFTNFFSQNKKENDYKKLIDSALVLKANDLYKFYNKQLQQQEKDVNWNININNLKEIINSIYVINENFSPVKLENVNADIPLKTLDIENPKNRKILKKGLNVWRIIPVLSGNELKITIINFTVTYKNKLNHFSNGGGSTVIFQYSCEDEKWKLIKEEHKGL